MGLARGLGYALSRGSEAGRGGRVRLSFPLATGAGVENAVVVAHHKDGVRDAGVLVVDDDEAVRIGTLDLLRDWGCVADAAESIEEALMLATKHAPDVVISDYRLRDQRTGLEAIAALRSVLGQSLPALLITGDTAPDRLREALGSNIPLLHKPVSPDHLHCGLMAVLVLMRKAKPHQTALSTTIWLLNSQFVKNDSASSHFHAARPCTGLPHFGDHRAAPIGQNHTGPNHLCRQTLCVTGRP